MDTATHRTRPYRSRAVPACQSCRARKSRCKLEDNATTCLMCRLYGTECSFNDPVTAAVGQSVGGTQSQEAGQTADRNEIEGRRSTRRQSREAEQPQDTSHTPSTTHSPVSHRTRLSESVQGNTSPAQADQTRNASQSVGNKRRRLGSHSSPSGNSTLPRGLVSPSLSVPVPGTISEQSCPPPSAPRLVDVEVSHSTPLSVYDKDQSNSHIVGPANTSDSQVLTDYLSCVHGTSSGMRLVRMMPTSWSKPVMFTPVQHRTFGKSSAEGLAYEKLNIMERLIGSNVGPLTDV